METGIPSPFMKRVPAEKQVVKNLTIEVQQNERQGNFLNMMSELSIMVVGIAAITSSLVYPNGSASDWLGTIAAIAWLLAGTNAIVEHSHANSGKERVKSTEQLINRAIEQFKKS